ncbi:MAG TPA: GNAT family N-acetyltransferase [Gemmataceae bacterium]|nr:GNAT family N-acetyltransferase [Gemmataceae bacterium]
MSHLSLIPAAQVNLRWILQRDLPCMLQIEQQPPAPQWTRQEFREVFQSADTAGWVAEFGGQVVGFLVYRVTSQPDLIQSVANRESDMRWYRIGREPARKPLGITLLNLAVAPSWRRRGIGRALLERIGQKLQHAGDSVTVSVPETNLPMQLLLRSAGYRALSVQRDYFGSEDGYLMEKRLG